MKFNLIYPQKRGYLKPDLAASVAVAAEEAGFHAFLVWDHYSMPDGPDSLDAWALLAYLAGKTSRIRLGTCVTPIPFRPPAQLAKVVASVDVLSGGRTILGVGAGWHQPEFDGFSRWETDAVRVDQTIEGLGLILKLWEGEPVDFEGRFYSARGAHIVPKPVQEPRPQLWFGVRGPRMMRLAARHGDDWIPTLISTDDYRAGMDQLKGLREAAGRPGEMKGAVQMWDAHTDRDKYLRDIEEHRAAGVGYYGQIWDYPPDEAAGRVDWFAREVMAKVR